MRTFCESCGCSLVGKQCYSAQNLPFLACPLASQAHAFQWLAGGGAAGSAPRGPGDDAAEILEPLDIPRGCAAHRP